MAKSRKYLIGVAVLGVATIVVFFGIRYVRGLSKTTRQSNVYPVYGCDNKSRVMDVVFVHGVDGDYQTTWQAPGEVNSSWLAWLGKSNPDIGVWSIDYPVATKVSGKTMALLDRSRNLVDLLINKGFAESEKRPLVFVTHSFGGLIAKQLLRTATGSNDPEWRSIARRTKGVVFIATPNQGSNFASFIRHVASRMNLTTVTEEELRADSSQLLDLNRWYRDHSPDMGIKTLSFAESEKIGGSFVVSPGSADPNIKDSEIKKLDANHINICKLVREDQQLFESTERFLRTLMNRLPPLVYPDPTGSLDAGGCSHSPSAEQVAAKAKHPADEVVLFYKNLTGNEVELVLFDWGRHFDGLGIAAWTHFETHITAKESHFEDFEPNRTGWFSVYVLSPNGKFSPCLDTSNLFSTTEPRIIIKHNGSKYEVEIK